MKKILHHLCSTRNQRNDYYNFNFTGSADQVEKYIKHTTLPSSTESVTILINPTYDEYKYLCEHTLASGSIEEIYRGGGKLTAINYIFDFKVPIGNLYISGSLDTTQVLTRFKVVKEFDSKSVHGYPTGSFALGTVCDSCKNNI